LLAHSLLPTTMSRSSFSNIFAKRLSQSSTTSSAAGYIELQPIPPAYLSRHSTTLELPARPESPSVLPSFFRCSPKPKPIHCWAIVIGPELVSGANLSVLPIGVKLDQVVGRVELVRVQLNNPDRRRYAFRPSTMKLLDPRAYYYKVLSGASGDPMDVRELGNHSVLTSFKNPNLRFSQRCARALYLFCLLFWVLCTGHLMRITLDLQLYPEGVVVVE
jgi:hypothetical protein